MDEPINNPFQELLDRFGKPDFDLTAEARQLYLDQAVLGLKKQFEELLVRRDSPAREQVEGLVSAFLDGLKGVGHISGAKINRVASFVYTRRWLDRHGYVWATKSYHDVLIEDCDVRVADLMHFGSDGHYPRLRQGPHVPRRKVRQAMKRSVPLNSEMYEIQSSVWPVKPLNYVQLSLKVSKDGATIDAPIQYQPGAPYVSLGDEPFPRSGS